jgi:hypothetical protein
MINEHDETKNMLSILREFQGVPKIDGLSNDTTAQESEDTVKLEGSEREEEVNKIKEAVAARVQIDEQTPIVYPYNDNVVIRGEFEGLRFEMSANDGLFISTNSLKISDNDIVEIIKKLDGYYDVWRDEWADKISDYKKDYNVLF